MNISKVFELAIFETSKENQGINVNKFSDIILSYALSLTGI